MIFAPDEAPIRGKTVERGQSRHLSEAGDVPKATACWGAFGWNHVHIKQASETCWKLGHNVAVEPRDEI